MAKFHGTNVNFGVSSSLAGVTGVFQTRGHTYNSSNESIMDGQGGFVADATYGLNETATFEYVATAAGGPGGSAAVTVPSAGDLLTVTDPSYTAIAQSNWIVRSVDTKGSNTSATRVTVNLWRATGITA